MDTNHTAAQPLDLDKLEEQVQRAYMADARCVAFLAPATILALIARARAAHEKGKAYSLNQAEGEVKGATGTTGASVKTWNQRILELEKTPSTKQMPLETMRAMAAEIDDLRAQLARQDELLADARMHWNDAVEAAREAEAQLAAKGKGEMVQVGHMRLLENGTKMGIGFDKLDEPLIEGWRQIPVFAHLSAPASAQPDRGAAQGDTTDDERKSFGDYFCMTLSCDGSESEELIDACRMAAEDAWMERARRAAPASPASQPVAQDALEEIKRLLAEQYETEIQRLKDIIKASPISAVSPSDAKDAAGWMVPLSKDGESVWIEGEGDVSLCRCTATSAADAKDAARLVHAVQSAFYPESCMPITEAQAQRRAVGAIRVAMAAAPSSEKGDGNW